MPLQLARKSGPTALVAGTLLCVLAACGTSPQPAPSSPPPTVAAPTSAAPTVATSAACADIAKLKASVDDLRKVNPAKQGAGSLTIAIKNVQTNLDAAEASTAASPELQAGVVQVKTAVAALQSAADGVTTGNIAQKAPAILAAIRGVATAMSDLSTIVDNACS